MDLNRLEKPDAMKPEPSFLLFIFVVLDTLSSSELIFLTDPKDHTRFPGGKEKKNCKL